MNQLIDNELGCRVSKFGYQYSGVIRNLTNVFLGGGDFFEDISGSLENTSKVSPTTVPQVPTTYQEV